MVLSAYDHENWFLKNKKRRRETVVSWVGGELVSVIRMSRLGVEPRMSECSYGRVANFVVRLLRRMNVCVDVKYDAKG